MNYSLVFNAQYYSSKYSDLKAAFGTDESQLLNHFILYGMNEGRQAIETFDVRFYKNKYPDLQKAFGNNWKLYYIHYIEHGYAENRQAYEKATPPATTIYQGRDYKAVFDSNYYSNKYADLKQAYNGNGTELFNHFVTYGMKEGRQASASFNPQYYKDNYVDLSKAFGANMTQYYIHYIDNGIKEKRVADRLLTSNKTYTSPSGSIVITKEKYQNVNVYAAHLTFTDYSRFKTIYHASATTSKAAALTNAIFCVNGSAEKLNGGGEMHDRIIPDFSITKSCTPALYSQDTGRLFAGFGSKYENWSLVRIRDEKIATDTLGFGNAYLKNGQVIGSQGGSRRPRTFIGTNEKPGDIWICVAEGDGINGGGAGLTGYDCATILKSKGCTLGYPMDGGGSSTMVFQGEVLNTPSEKGKERGYIGDFVYFR